MKFWVDSQVWHETPDEDQRMHQPKHCKYNNEYKDDSLNIFGDKKKNKTKTFVKQSFLEVSVNKKFFYKHTCMRSLPHIFGEKKTKTKTFVKQPFLEVSVNKKFSYKHTCVRSLPNANSAL